jgi:hypothetical protein
MPKQESRVVELRIIPDMSRLMRAVTEASDALDRFKRWSDTISGRDFDYQMAEVMRVTA